MYVTGCVVHAGPGVTGPGGGTAGYGGTAAGRRVILRPDLTMKIDPDRAVALDDDHYPANAWRGACCDETQPRKLLCCLAQLVSPSVEEHRCMMKMLMMKMKMNTCLTAI